jgi:hypothetical protein
MRKSTRDDDSIKGSLTVAYALFGCMKRLRFWVESVETVPKRKSETFQW